MKDELLIREWRNKINKDANRGLYIGIIKTYKRIKNVYIYIKYKMLNENEKRRISRMSIQNIEKEVKKQYPWFFQAKQRKQLYNNLIKKKGEENNFQAKYGKINSQVTQLEQLIKSQRSLKDKLEAANLIEREWRKSNINKKNNNPFFKVNKVIFHGFYGNYFNYGLNNKKKTFLESLIKKNKIKKNNWNPSDNSRTTGKGSVKVRSTAETTLEKILNKNTGEFITTTSNLNASIQELEKELYMLQRSVVQ